MDREDREDELHYKEQVEEAEEGVFGEGRERDFMAVVGLRNKDDEEWESSWNPPSQ